MADGYAGIFIRQNIPSQPAGLTLVQNGDIVQITWNVNSNEDIASYEVWSSVGNNTDFKLLTTIPKTEFAGQATITFIDDTFNRATTIYYRIHAVYTYNYSPVLTGNITVNYQVPDPIDLVVEPGVNDIKLSWKNNDSRLLEGVQIKMDKNADDTQLDETNAVQVYSGMAGSYTYAVDSADTNLWHQFWISSITRT